MTDKINYLKESGAIFLEPPGGGRALELANAAFQQMKASVLPAAIADFYRICNGALMGDSCVFPLADLDRPARNYIVMGIIAVNRLFSEFAAMRGKTIWGRNMFYLFSADISGNMYMHDALTLQVLRKCADFGACLTDCLLVGKI